MDKKLTWFTIGSIVNINDLADENKGGLESKMLVRVKHLGGHEQIYVYAGLNKLEATKDELILLFFVADESDNYYEIVEII